MVERLNTRNIKEYPLIVDYLVKNFDYDFYLTEENSRIYITDISSLKKLFRSSIEVFVSQENGDYEGIILLWKSQGGGKTRYYIKLNAINEDAGNRLLTVLLWNTNVDLFTKIRKDSQFSKIYRTKGFKFKGGRGIQILLHRKYKKEEK